MHRRILMVFVIMSLVIATAIAWEDPWMNQGMNYNGKVDHSIDGSWTILYTAHDSTDLPGYINFTAEDRARNGDEYLGWIPQVTPDPSLKTTDPRYSTSPNYKKYDIYLAPIFR